MKKLIPGKNIFKFSRFTGIYQAGEEAGFDLPTCRYLEKMKRGKIVKKVGRPSKQELLDSVEVEDDSKHKKVSGDKLASEIKKDSGGGSKSRTSRKKKSSASTRK